MKLATFNVNSIRRRLSVVVDWVKRNRPDVLCLQETKVQDSEFPLEELTATGYHVTYRGMKGYNGVALLSRVPPEFVSFGLGSRQYPDEPRLIHVVVKGIPVINTYIPQGFRIDSPKFQYKLQWFQRLRRYFAKHLFPTRPAIWCGDMNVAPEPVDVHSPEKHKDHVCFHEDAQRAYQKTMAWGFQDVFRRLYPHRQQYTFWDYRQPSAVDANRGWRIDHILATPVLAQRCTKVEVDMGPRRNGHPSDHTVLWAKFSI
ncbi:MAG: exodeoxyribonuclease III [Nitrospirales bacterium]